MHSKKQIWLYFTIVLLLVAACTQPTRLPEEIEVQETAVETTQPPIDLTLGDQNLIEESEETETIVAVETAVVPVQSEEASTSENELEVDKNGVPVGFTADGYPYRGYLDATIVIEEYSDYQ